MENTVKKVVIPFDEWEKIVKYLYEITVPFGHGKRTGEVEDAIAKAMVVDTIEKSND